MKNETKSSASPAASAEPVGQDGITPLGGYSKRPYAKPSPATRSGR